MNLRSIALSSALGQDICVKPVAAKRRSGQGPLSRGLKFCWRAGLLLANFLRCAAEVLAEQAA
jgi:hypothetical protein